MAFSIALTGVSLQDTGALSAIRFSDDSAWDWPQLRGLLVVTSNDEMRDHVATGDDVYRLVA